MNRRSIDYESIALPTEPHQHISTADIIIKKFSSFVKNNLKNILFFDRIYLYDFKKGGFGVIEQQIFIKTGIGLETGAKSSGLTDEYIASHIRPFYSSLDLFYLEGKDSPGYKSLIPLSDGSIIIGTGVKTKKDSSCIHNYHISPDMADEICKNAASLLSYPEDTNTNSPHLASFSAFSHTGAFTNKLKKKFSALKMSHTEYMALLSAIFAAVEQNRNVFIALPRKTNIDEISAIMFGLYENLPYYVRQKAGFSTLFGETEIKPEINIYFIPEDKIMPGRDNIYIETYNASRDYVFNLKSKTYYHISDLKESLSGEYFTFVSEMLSSSSSLSDFFSFAEEASSNLPHERKLSLRFYNDLTYIYNILNNEETLPQKAGRVTIIFTELMRSGAKVRLLSSYSDFLRLYRRFIKQKNTLIPPEILKRLVITYDFCPNQQKDELYDLVTLDIDNCLKVSENDILFLHIDTTKAASELYNKIIEIKMAPSNRFIKRYFTYLTEQRKTVHSLMEFVDSVFSEMPQLSGNDLIRNMFCERAKELYDTSGDRFEAVKYLESKCLSLKENHPKNANLFSAIYHYALENYMTTLNVSELNCAKIEKFPLTDGESINEDCTIKHKIAMAAKEILDLTYDVAMSFIHYDSFGFGNVKENLINPSDASSSSEDELKNLLLKCLKEKKEAPRRIIYIILYYIFSSKDSKVQVNFDGIIDFIDKELNIPPFEFSEWYLSSNLYMTPFIKNGRIIRQVSDSRADVSALNAFYDSVKSYFLRHSEHLASDRSMKKFFKEIDSVSLNHQDYRELSAKFKKDLAAIISDKHSFFRRMAGKIVSYKNFKFTTLLIGVAAILLIGFSIGGLFSAENNKSEVLATVNSGTYDKTFTDRTGWSSYRLKKDGTFLPAEGVIDGGIGSEKLELERDQYITISFANKGGIVINGISISAVIPDEKVGMDVYVYDENNKKLAVGVSDYDIASGSSLYTFASPMCIKKITIHPKGDQVTGTVILKEVNAYIIK